MTDHQRLPKSLRRRVADERSRPPCADCSHAKADHYTDPNGRPVCGGAVCACYGYRAVVPMAHRDDYDDSALPRLRHDWSGGAA